MASLPDTLEGVAASLACTSVQRRPSALERAALIVCSFCLSIFGLWAVLFQSWSAAGIALPLGVAAVLMGHRARKRRGGEVLLDDNGLLLVAGGLRSRVTKEDVVGAYDVPSERTAVLSLTNGSRFELALAAADPEEVLAHVGQTLEQRAVSAPLRRAIGPFTMGLVSLCALWLGAAMAMGSVKAALPPAHAPALESLLPFLFALVATAVIVKRFGSPQAIVGVDGIRVTGGLRSTFIPYANVVGAIVGDAGVNVLLANGETFDLPMVTNPEAEAAALATRITRGLAAHRAGSAIGGEQLSSLGRPFRAWREDLERLAAAGGGFRDAALRLADLDAVLADPSSPTEQRVGAALALRSIDPDAASRVRVAAAQAADERVRVVLEMASADEVDEAHLEDALKKLRV